MTLSEILGNEELRRHEFPVAAHKIFLAHAAVCPLPRRVSEAISRVALAGAEDDQERAVGTDLLAQTRALAARLLSAQPEEIAFVGPTSLALSYVAAGLKFHRGDNVVIYFDDYPSNVYPWMALAQKGVQVRLLNVREPGLIRPRDVLGQVDENTRLVALASCHFLTGWRIELAAIGEALQKRNVAFCVDGIQTAGAFPTSVEHIDFLAADAHKWMLGPSAAGILYVRQAMQDKLRPPVYGWHNVRCPNFVAQEHMVQPPDARRYEVGTANLLGLVGMRAAMELLLEIGIDAIAAELFRKRSWVVPALQQKGYTVFHADASVTNAASIITFSRPDTDMAALHEKLAAANIVTSLRGDRAGKKYVRFSAHFYNTDAELHRVLEML